MLKERGVSKLYLIFGILFFSLMFTPSVSAFEWCEWIPFWECSDDDTGNTLTAGAKWILDYSTDEGFFVWIDDAKTHKATICLVSETATSTSELEDKEFYTADEKKSKLKETVEKLKAEKIKASDTGFAQDYYGYCYTIKDKEKKIKFGSHSTALEFANDTLEVTDVNGTVLQDVTLEYNTDQCLINCKAGGHAVLYNDGVLFEDLDFVDNKNNYVDLGNAEIYLITEIPGVNITVPNYIDNCTTEQWDEDYNAINTTNSTVNGCSVAHYSGEINITSDPTFSYTSYNFTVLPAGTYDWEIKGSKSQLNNIDWAVAFQGFETDTIREYWAWWNSSWSYKREISNLTGEYPTFNLSKEATAKDNWGDTRFLDEYAPAGVTELNFTFRELGNGLGQLYSSLPTSITTNLYAYYELEDLTDSKGSNDLTNSGGTFVAGKINNAISLDGSSNYLNGTNTYWDDDQDLTISFWTKLDALQNGDHFLTIGGGTSSDLQMTIKLGPSGDGTKLDVGFLRPGVAIYDTAQSGRSFNTGEWYMVTVTYDGTTKEFTGFMNANEEMSNTLTHTTSPSSTGLRIGTGASAGGSPTGEYLDGIIDELLISQSILTIDEIRELYNAQWATVTVDSNFLSINSTSRDTISWFYGNNDADTTSNAVNTFGESEPVYTFDGGRTMDDGVPYQTRNYGASEASGYIYDSYTFDGTSDYMEAIDYPSTAYTEDLSVSAWINLDATGSNRAIWSSGEGSGAFNNVIYLSATGQVRWQIFTNGVGSAIELTGDTLSAGTWYHVVGTYDGGTQEAKLYIDNVLKDTDTATSTGTAGSDGFFVGVHTDAGSGLLSYFDGEIDELGVWNKVLTTDDIDHLYGINIQTDTLILGSQETQTTVEINLITPLNNTNFSVSDINFQCNCLATTGLDNCTQINLTIDGVVVETDTGTGSFNLTSTETVADGNHNWTCLALNQTGFLYNTSTRFFSVDTTAPFVNITAPLNLSLITEFNESIELNWTIIDDAGNLDICYYNTSTNSTEVIVTCALNTTIVNYPISNPETFSIYLFANDTLGNEATDNVTVVKNTIEPNVTIIEPLDNFVVTVGNQSIDLNWTINANGSLDVCWYNLFGGEPYLSTTFNNSLSEENLTFTGNQNITRFLSIAENISVSNTLLNLNGFYSATGDRNVSQDNSEVYTTGTWNPSFPAVNTYDGNHSTYGAASTPFTAKVYYNYTIPENADNTSTWIAHVGRTSTPALEGQNISMAIPASCWDVDGKVQVMIQSHSISPNFKTDMWCINSTGAEQYITQEYGGTISNARRIYGSYINWSILSYPTNPSIYINDSLIWNTNPNLNSSISVSSFENTLNNYLLDCTFVSGFCDVPFIFHSDTAGIFEYSDIRFDNIFSSEIVTCADNSTTFNYPLSNPDFVNVVMYSNDTLGNEGNDTVLIQKSTETPIITITSPPALFPLLVNGTVIDLDFSIETNGTLDTCWLEYNGVNTTIPGCLNSTFVYEFEQDNLTLYANDTLGNIGSQFTSWTRSLNIVGVFFVTETLEGISNSFVVSVETNDSVTSGTLIYDGTNYTGVIIETSPNNYNISYDLIAPSVVNDTNFTFNWILELAVSGTAVLPDFNQTVTSVTLDNCSVFTFPILNLSLYEERSQAPLVGTIEVAMNILNTVDFEVVEQLSGTFENINNTLVCSSVNLTGQDLVYSSEIKYYATGFESELYYIQRAEFDSINNVALYDLNSSYSTEFLVEYENENFVIVPGAVIQLQRKYISEDVYKVVEAPLTSNDGTAILHIDLDSNLYKATVVKDGVLLEVFDNIVFACQNQLSGECSQNLRGSISPNNYVDIVTVNDFSYGITNSVDTITVTWAVPSTGSADVNLQVRQVDGFGNSTVCNETVSSSAGSIVCTYDNTTITDSYLYLDLYKDGEPMASTSYYIRPSGNLDFLGTNFILVFIFLLSISGMAFSSPEWVVVNGIMVMMISGGLYLVNGLNFVMGLGSLMWLIVGASILIYKMAQQEDR